MGRDGFAIMRFDMRHETLDMRHETRAKDTRLLDKETQLIISLRQRLFQVCFLVLNPSVLQRILQDGHRVEACGQPFVSLRVARRAEMARERIRAHELFRRRGNGVEHGEDIARIAGFIREACADVCVAGDSLGEVYAVVIGHRLRDSRRRKAR